MGDLPFLWRTFRNFQFEFKQSSDGSGEEFGFRHKKGSYGNSTGVTYNTLDSLGSFTDSSLRVKKCVVKKNVYNSNITLDLPRPDTSL